jgi:hypothetical protein
MVMLPGLGETVTEVTVGPVGPVVVPPPLEVPPPPQAVIHKLNPAATKPAAIPRAFPIARTLSANKRQPLSSG